LIREEGEVAKPVTVEIVLSRLMRYDIWRKVSEINGLARVQKVRAFLMPL